MVDILADVSTKYARNPDPMHGRTLPNIQGVVSTNSSNVSSLKDPTLKLIEAQNMQIRAQGVKIYELTQFVRNIPPPIPAPTPFT